MDGIILLREARAAGLSVEVMGNSLRIRGPKRAEHIAERLLRHKPAVLAELNRKTNDVSTASGWDAVTATLIGWFLTEGQYLVPSEPFHLYPWVHVFDPEKFKNSIRFDINWGPSGPRNLYGALTADLQRLKELFDPDQFAHEEKKRNDEYGHRPK